MKYQIFPCTTQQDAEVIVLSSGLGGHASFWEPQIEILTEYFQVLVYNQEGCHSDSALLPTPYSMRNMAQQVLEILKTAQIQKCHFIGHALGAIIGAELAVLVQNSEFSISSLTFINAWDQLDPHTQKCFEARLALLNNTGAKAYVRAQALFLYPPAYISKNIDQIRKSEDLAIQDFPPIENVLARLNALMNFGISSEHIQALAETNLYFIANKDDFLVPFHKSTDLKNVLGHGELHIFESGAHASTVTEAVKMNQLLIQNLVGEMV